jgi:hypothetical protein
VFRTARSRSDAARSPMQIKIPTSAVISLLAVVHASPIAHARSDCEIRSGDSSLLTSDRMTQSAVWPYEPVPIDKPQLRRLFQRRVPVSPSVPVALAAGAR